VSTSCGRTSDLLQLQRNQHFRVAACKLAVSQYNRSASQRQPPAQSICSKPARRTPGDENSMRSSMDERCRADVLAEDEDSPAQHRSRVASAPEAVSRMIPTTTQRHSFGRRSLAARAEAQHCGQVRSGQDAKRKGPMDAPTTLCTSAATSTRRAGLRSQHRRTAAWDSRRPLIVVSSRTVLGGCPRS
jgi:hypothetical protein